MSGQEARKVLWDEGRGWAEDWQDCTVGWAWAALLHGLMREKPVYIAPAPMEELLHEMDILVEPDRCADHSREVIEAMLVIAREQRLLRKQTPAQDRMQEVVDHLAGLLERL